MNQSNLEAGESVVHRSPKAVTVRIRARRVFVLGTVLASLLLVALPRAHALDPDRRISQYAHTAWRVRDGAFAGAPSAITQTTDGYVWIGTFAGLLRFDGVRFVPFAPPAGQHLPNPAVISLLGATDGSLWIGTASGLAQWKNGELFTFPETAGRVNSIYEDRDGTIWMARSRTDAGGVCKVAVSVATCYTPKDGVPPNASVLIGDNLGYFLIGGSTALFRWKPGSSTSYELPGLKSKQGLNGIADLALAPDGSVWVGIVWPGHGLGLQRWVNGSWQTLITPTFDSSTLRVYSLRLDRHNALWIATDDAGIYRVHDGTLDRFASADGLTSNSVESFFEDKEGNLWLTTAGGVDCFRNIPVVSFSVHEGLSADAVGSILAARDGTVWIGNQGALDILRGNVVSSIGPKHGLRGNRATSLFEDHAGRLWVGLDNGLLVYEHGRFTPVLRPDGGPVGIVLAMAEDIDHNVWASVIRNPPGRPTRLICFRDGKFVKEISDLGLDVVSLAADPQSGLWLGLIQGGLARYRNDRVQVFPIKDANARVSQVLANSDGSVLAATNLGLVERRGDSQHTLDGDNGLPCNRIFALITDKHSDLWLYAECGLIKIKSDDLQRWLEHPDVKVKFDLFDAFDGAQPYLPPFRPVASRSNDGRLWFANDTVAQMIDPDGLLRNPIPPPVHIEDVIADRKTYSPQNGLHLPALTRDLEIDYTALSFVVPQKVHFQYKLEGYDREWQDAGTRRQAFYTNLPPRDYTFRVKACNNSGQWNEAGASLNFFVAPAYYQTVWFRSLAVLLLLGVLTGLYRFRVRHLERQRDALRKSEKEFRDVIDTIPAIVWSTLPDGSNTYVNRRFIEYSGLSGERTTESGWKAAVHPDDLERQMGKWMDAVATGKSLESEVRLRCSDGQYRWQLDRGVPLRDEDGNIVGWYGVVTDIEDRKRAEGALQQSQFYLVEGQRLAHTGSWAFNAAGFEYWSSELFRIYGLDPGGKPPTVEEYLALVHPEDRAFMKQGIAKMLDDHLAFDFTKRIVRSDGEIRHVRCVGVPVTQGGIFQGFLGTGMDVTEHELLTQELRRREAYLAEAQRLSQTGSFGWKPDSGEIVWSDETYRIFEYDHAVKPTIDLVVQRLHPEDRPDFLKVIESASAGETQFEHTYRLLLPDGSVKYVHALAHASQDASGNREFVGAATDVSSIKRAEEELRKSEAYLAEAQTLSQTGSWAWSPDQDIRYWSEECYRVLGFDPQDGLPRFEDFFQRLHPDDQPGYREIIQTAIREKAEWEADYRIVRPDGPVRDIHVVGHPVLSTSGHLVEFVGTVIDVTERKRAEEELRKSEFYLAEGQRLGHTGSWALNPSGFFEYWSRELFQIYGLDPQKGAPTLEQYLATIHPRDRDFMAETVKRMCEQGSGCDVKKRIIRPDGAVRYVRCVSIPVLDHGILKRFLGTAMDVTEQEQLTQELQRREVYLAEAQKLTHTGSWAWNVRTDERFWSEETFRIFDIDPVKVKPAWSVILDRVHPDDRASLEQRRKMDSTQTEWAESESDFRIVVPDGKIKHLHSIAHPVMDASGQIIEVIGTVVDVTERKSAEDALRQAQAALAHVTRLTTMGEMTASIAHEINQPLSGVVSNGSACLRWLAGDSPNLEEAREAARRIVRDGKRAGEVITRIRALAKKTDTAMGRLDINETIREVLSLARDEVRRNDASVRLDLADNLFPALGDRVQLQQVVLNLIMNGIEAMSNVGGRPRELIISTRNVEANQVQVTIQDSGVGLKPQDMDRIFAAFYTTKPAGMGLGLSISRSIVQNHGGRLWATANDGPGTTLQFTVPKYQQEPSIAAV